MREETLTNPLAIIGNGGLISGFKALGFKTYTAETTDECKIAAAEVLSGAFHICLVQEELFETAEDQRKQHKERGLFVFIPFSKDAQTQTLDKMVRGIRLRATGAF
jgi:vacuolar-type H+-ATPase subunit F/Vma7